MHDLRYGFAALLALLAATAGCGTARGGGDTDLPGSTWELVELEGSAVTPADDRGRPTLELAADGGASGFAGCNRFHGAYTLAGDSLRFGDLGLTRMACPASMATETSYTRLLSETRTYRVTDGRLELLIDGRVGGRLERRAP